MLVTLEVLKPLTSRFVRLLQPQNILDIFVTLEVLRYSIFIIVFKFSISQNHLAHDLGRALENEESKITVVIDDLFKSLHPGVQPVSAASKQYASFVGFSPYLNVNIPLLYIAYAVGVALTLTTIVMSIKIRRQILLKSFLFIVLLF